MDPPSGTDLKILRIRKDLRQYRVAQHLNIPPSVLCDFERGRRRLTPERASAIADAIEALAGIDGLGV